MTPAEHRAEAERLVAFAMDVLHSDEGGYNDSDADPSPEELATRSSIYAEARRDAKVYLAAAQVHATIAASPAAAQRVPAGCSQCTAEPVSGACRAEILAWLNAGPRCFAEIMRAPWCATVMETGGVTDEVELLDGSRLVLADGTWVPKAGA